MNMDKFWEETKKQAEEIQNQRAVLVKSINLVLDSTDDKNKDEEASRALEIFKILQ